MSIDLNLINLLAKKLLLIAINTSIKTSILILVISLLLKINKNISARIKHLLWFISILIIAFTPIFSQGLIQIGFPINDHMNFLQHINNGVIKLPFNFSSDPIYDQLDTNSTRKRQSGQHDKNKYHYSRFHWSVYTLALWYIIFQGLIIYFLTGFYQINKIIKQTSKPSSKYIDELVENFKQKNHFRNNLTILTSPQCYIPVSFHYWKNYVILPENSANWTKQKLQLALDHEMTHIMRKDCITQNIARIICYLFWFIPPVWYVYKRIKIEQENACDYNVVHRGVNPFEYAETLLNFAHNNITGDLSSTLLVPMVKTSVLEQRITNIIQIKPVNIHYGFKKQAKVLLLFIVMLIPFHLINPVQITTERELLQIAIKKFRHFDENVNLSLLASSYKNAIKALPMVWPMLKDGNLIYAQSYNILNQHLKEYYTEIIKKTVLMDNLTINTGFDFSLPLLEKGYFIFNRQKNPLIANADGVIEKIEFQKPYGFQITIKHPSGLTSTYSLLSSIDEKNLKLHKKIKQGEIIGSPMHSQFHIMNQDYYISYCLYNIKSKDRLINTSDYLNSTGKQLYFSIQEK